MRDLFQEAGISINGQPEDDEKKKRNEPRDLFAEAGFEIEPKEPGLLDPVRNLVSRGLDSARDIGSAVYGGAEGTGRSIGAAGNTVTGDLRDVEDYAARQRAAQEDKPEALRRLTQEFQTRQEALGDDPGIIDSIKAVGGAMVDNPEGAVQFAAEQLPNSAVVLGSGFAGAKAGAALGSLGGPISPITVPIGGAIGLIGGLFLGGAGLEIGGKAIEKAEDGFTEAERGEAITEGAKKAAFMAAVDTATLGAGRLVSRGLNRAAIDAGAKAEARVLADAGVDIGSREAVETALAADKALFAAAKEAGEESAKAVSTFGKQLTTAGTVGAMETVGEGLGEYLGELAATGKADVYNAVIESLAGLSQSAAETVYNVTQAQGNDLSAKGINRAAPDVLTEDRTSAPDARLAQLEQIGQQRDLTAQEQQEAADLLTAMNQQEPAPEVEQELQQEIQQPTPPQVQQTAPSQTRIDAMQADQRLAELELTASQRDLTPDEQTEVNTLFAVLEQAEQAEMQAAQESAQAAVPQATDPVFNAAEVAVKAAKIARREDPLSLDPRVDRIGAREQYLRDLVTADPATALQIAEEFRRNPDAFAEQAQVSPEKIGSYAAIIEQQLKLQQSNEQRQQAQDLQQVTPPDQLAGVAGVGAEGSQPMQVAPIDPGAGSTVAPGSLPAAQDVNLQNRDRSRAASVMQMAEIAKNPDFVRLGLSNSPETGAPMVFSVGNDATNIPQTNVGRPDVAVMSDGQRVPFRYAVLEADSVQPSNFATGEVNPEFTSNVPGTVKALNNGRTAGVRGAYDQGTANQYRADLTARATDIGIDPAIVQRMRAPMLVRVYSEQDNTANMAAKSQGQALGMSPGELARQDAGLIDTSTLTAYQSGDLASAANRDFVRSFIGRMNAEGQDVAGMMTDVGTLSPQGLRRIEAALTQAAYSDADLVEELFDSLDTDIRAIGEALKTVAGEWANMRDSVRLGVIAPDVDVTDNLIQAVNMIRKARRDKISLYDLSRQVDLTVGDIPDPITLGMLNIFYTGTHLTRAVGKEKIIDQLRDYVTQAMATSNGADMFGESIGASDIITALTQPGGFDAIQQAATESQVQPSGGSNAGNTAGQGGGAGQRQVETEQGDNPAQSGSGVTQTTQQPDRQRNQEGGNGTGQEQQGFGLTQQTPEELAQIEAQRQESARAAREAEQRAQADAQVDDFRLSGSDRAVDLAEAAGQTNIFDMPAEPETQAAEQQYLVTGVQRGNSKQTASITVTAKSREGAIEKARESNWFVPKEARPIEGDTAVTAEQAIRESFRALPNVTLGEFYPITVQFNGRTQQFLASQRALKGNKAEPVITLLQINKGKMLADMPSEYIATMYKLDANNKLTEQGSPKVAGSGQIKQWRNAGFELPALDSPKAKETKPKKEAAESTQGQQPVDVDKDPNAPQWVGPSTEVYKDADKGMLRGLSEVGKNPDGLMIYEGRGYRAIHENGYTAINSTPVGGMRNMIAEFKTQQEIEQQFGKQPQTPSKAAVKTTAVREMGQGGRPADGKPVLPGDVFRTLSGRETTPYPKQKSGKYATQWLIDNAIAEAQSRGDDFNATVFAADKPGKDGSLPQASIESMQMYLFEQQPSVAKPMLKPLVSKNTIVTDDAAEKARALLRKKLGQLNSGLDPEVFQAGVQLAIYHIERGARTFAAYAKAMIDDMGDMAEPYLKQWYEGVRYDPRSTDIAPTMSNPMDVFTTDIKQLKEGFNVQPTQQSTGSNQQSANEKQGDEGAISDASEGAKRSSKSSGKTTGTAADRSDRDRGVSDNGTATGGKPSDSSLFTDTGGFKTDNAGGNESSTSIVDQSVGVESGSTAIGSTEQLAGRVASLEEKIELQRKAESIPVKFANKTNIDETLPLLLDGQREDVFKAEQRWAQPNGYGMLFTNGTGTGKTLLGLGSLKRMERMGKGNIIVVVPNEAVVNAWVNDAKKIGLNITPLESTSTAGKGIVITTYANFGQNDELAKRNWDAVVMDEAHSLMQNSQAEDTRALDTLRAIALHPDGWADRAKMQNRELVDRMAENQKSLEGLRSLMNNDDTMDVMRAEYQREIVDLETQMLKDLDAWRKAQDDAKQFVADNQGEKRPRALFLSATPFAYEKNIRWAEGFLFEFGQKKSQAYNAPDGYEQFMITHFGYRMRYNKLTEPDAKVDRDLMQRNFNTWLRKQGALSTRLLDVEADYERKFVLISGGIGQKIDEGLDWLRTAENGRYSFLNTIVTDKFDRLTRVRLLEAIKARAAVDYIKKHHELGRKVVVFYDFNVGGGSNVFDMEQMYQTMLSVEADPTLPDDVKYTDVPAKGQGKVDYRSTKTERVLKSTLVKEFMDARRDLQTLNFADYGSPLRTLLKAFPNAGVYNGMPEYKKTRIQAIKDFNDDDQPNKNLLLVQKAANAGWSGHDTTGKHQRVLINLGLPTAPIESIQQEGRVYRTGQITDAIFQYFNTGTNWERYAFGSTISRRAGTAENLAMGEQARGLRESFIQAFEDSDPDYSPNADEGKGGKKKDRELVNAITEFDRAKALYYAQQKKTSKNKAAEGKDYFATPEPIGLKMVEFADIRFGESVLEPSAGHGAIARWFPEKTDRTMIEPSQELASRLSLASDGKIIDDVFENHNIVNKYDAIVMNPPFGVGGKVAIEHLDKATKHLRDGGRVVALIPEGPAADKRFEQWLYGSENRPVKPVANIPGFGDVYLGDTVESRASWAPTGKVTGINGDSLMIQTKPGSSSAVTFQAITSVTSVKSTGVRSKEVRTTEDLVLVANLSLPNGVFERAGTNVKTRIVVIEKLSNPEDRARVRQSNLDFSNRDSVEEIFDAFEQLSISPRLKLEEEAVPANAPVRSSAREADMAAREAEKQAQESGVIAQTKEDIFFEPKGDKLLTNAPVVKVTTAKGKELEGVLIPNATLAKQIDKFTYAPFGRNQGFFVRLRHVERPQRPAMDPDRPMFSRAPAVESKEFKNWFGKSQVVDRQGNPLLVYHGSPDLRFMKEDGIFKSEKEKFGMGRSTAAHWFTPSINTARTYADPRRAFDYQNAEEGIVQAYIKLENPLIVDGNGRDWFDVQMRGKTSNVIEQALSEGRDGVIIKNVKDDYNNDSRTRPTDTYVVFNSTQIKSATENKGTFDPENPDIRMDRRVETGKAMTVASVENIATRMMDAWQRKPGLVVVANMQDANVPQAVRQMDAEQRSNGATGSPRAFFYRGNVYLLADQIKSPTQLATALFHETLGHFGLRGAFGNSLDDVLNQLVMARPELIKAKAKEYGLDLKNKDDRLTAAEEVLAELAQTQPQLGFVRRAIAAVRIWIRNNVPGFKDLALSDNEIIQGFIIPARDWVRNGASREPSIYRGAMYSRGEGNANQRRLNPIGMYSALSEFVSSAPAKMNGQSGNQWKQWIESNAPKSGVKKDELEWSGVLDYLTLQGKEKVSKAQLSTFVDANGVRVEEADMRSMRDVRRISEQAAAEYGIEVDPYDEEISFYNQEGESLEFDELPAGLQNQLRPLEGTNITKYQAYQLPGGDNYREVVLTLPVASDRSRADAEMKAFNAKITERVGREGWSFDDMTEAEIAEYDRLNDAQGKASTERKAKYKSNHWDQPNVVAHIRLNDRIDSEGKRVLFVEEIQSDWGQEGKKKGFGLKDKTPLTKAEDDELMALYDLRSNRTPEQTARMNALNDRLNASQGKPGIPLAPFVTDTKGWLGLGLKRVISMAVQGGYDKVAFVNGQQAADRFDLSKQVDSLLYYKNDDGTYRLSALTGGMGNMLGENIPEDRLDDYVGKEVAKKIIDGDGKRTQVQGAIPYMMQLETKDLKVGGQGMKAFYDQLVPQAANALLKKLGSKLDQTTLPGTKSKDELAASVYGAGETYKNLPSEQKRRIDAMFDKGGKVQPAFSITNEMREKVLTDGLPLFSRAPAVESKEFKNWFGDSKVVDSQGKPMVVYHGTDKDFSTFTRGKVQPIGGVRFQDAQGFYFADDPGYASDYGGTVMPVYLLIKNPFIVPADGFDHTYVSKERRDELESQGYDGIIAPEVEGGRFAEYVVFRPGQIKSATGNRGTFDPANPDIRFSRTNLNGNVPPKVKGSQQSRWSKAKARALRLTSPEVLSALIYKFQDRFTDLKAIRDHIKALGGTISDLNDAYLGEELYHKRLAKRTEDFLAKEIKPLMAQMRSMAISRPEFEQYLHARHAPEANKVLAERNPNQAMIDKGRKDAADEVKNLRLALQTAKANGTATKAIEDSIQQAQQKLQEWNSAQAYKGTEAERNALSGMTDAEANQIMASMPTGRKQNMEVLAKQVDAMNEKTLKTLEDYGLIPKAQLDAWRKTYKHYVPLFRDDAHPETKGHPIGQGFSVRGAGMKQRTGSTSEVTNILGHIAMQREAALTRGEKNNVVKRLYLMAAQNLDPKVWKLDKAPTISTVDSKTGFVTTRPDPNFKNLPNVISLRIAGKDRFIVINEDNPQAMRMATALKNLDLGELDVVSNLVAKGTRWFASINTQYNPVFGAINFARDVQAALLNLSSTPLAGKQKQVAKAVVPALRAIYRETRGKSAANAKNKEWMRLWDELQLTGGTTGYRDMFADIKDRTKALEKELSALERGKVAKAANAVVKWLSDYNETAENAVRVAAYKVALDSGMTKERAASLAKNLTVNFNRKGSSGRSIGAWYAFFNAAIQGTTRMVETLSGPAGKKIMYGGVALGMFNSLIAMAVMGGLDDDEEEDNYSKIPEFVRERSLIIPLGKEDYFAFPMPLGFNVLPNIGRIAAEWAFGRTDKSNAQRISDLIVVIADSFNPLGGSAPVAQMAAPTVIDPMLALIQNKDWTGQPIFREDFSNLDPTPGFKRTKDSASTPSKLIAEALNTVSGGNEYRPGAWSPTPDQLDFIFETLTGGVGRELVKLNTTVTAPFTGDELPAYRIPLVGRMYGNTSGPSGESSKFYENIKELNIIENELQGRSKAGESVDELLENPVAGLVGAANEAEKQVRELRKMRRQIVSEGLPDSSERAKEINKDIGMVMKELNQRMSSVKEAEK